MVHAGSAICPIANRWGVCNDYACSCCVCSHTSSCCSLMSPLAQHLNQPNSWLESCSMQGVEGQGLTHSVRKYRQSVFKLNYKLKRQDAHKGGCKISATAAAKVAK